MKKFLVVIGYLCIASSGWAQLLPREAFVTNHNESYREDTKLDTQREWRKSQKEIGELLSLQKTVLEHYSQNQKNKSALELSQMRTDFSVWRSGLIGLSALKATSALEVTWKKKGTRDLPEVMDLEINEDDINKWGIPAIVSQLVTVVQAVNLGIDIVILRKSLTEMVRTMQRTMGGVDVTRSPNWKLKGVRMEVSVGAGGRLYYVVKLEARMRLRLLWKKSEKSIAKINREEKSRSSLINALFWDLEQSIGRVRNENFDIEHVAVGLGQGSNGSIGVASTYMGFLGYLMFIKVKPSEAPQTINNYPDTEDEDLILTGVEDEKGRSIRLSRRRWRKSLAKGENLMLLASQQKLNEGQWQLHQIRNMFTLTKFGMLGFSSLGTDQTIEILLRARP